MLGLKNNKEDEIGMFIEEERDLKKQLKEFIRDKKKIEKRTLFIDRNITDITYFIKHLKEIQVPLEEVKIESFI